MKPFVLPASTSIALVAGALATMLVWALKQWGGVDVPDYVRDSFVVIVTALGGHFTTDSPPAAVAREAVSDAADVVDAAAAASKSTLVRP